MSYVAVGTVGLVCVGGVIAARSVRIMNELRYVKTIEDAVSHVKKFGEKYKSTDEFMRNLTDQIRHEGIHEDTLISLSALHREWQTDLGMYGFAINTLWHSVLVASNEEGWVFVPD